MRVTAESNAAFGLRWLGVACCRGSAFGGRLETGLIHHSSTSPGGWERPADWGPLVGPDGRTQAAVSSFDVIAYLNLSGSNGSTRAPAVSAWGYMK